MFKTIWAHLSFMRNESVLILKICGMHMFVYWEYAKQICLCIYQTTWNERKVKYLGKFKTKIKNILGHLSGAQMCSCGQTTLNQKISYKCTFNKESYFTYNRINRPNNEHKILSNKRVSVGRNVSKVHSLQTLLCPGLGLQDSLLEIDHEIVEMKNGSAKKILRGTPHDDRNLISHSASFCLFYWTNSCVRRPVV